MFKVKKVKINNNLYRKMKVRISNKKKVNRFYSVLNRIYTNSVSNIEFFLTETLEFIKIFVNTIKVIKDELKFRINFGFILKMCVFVTLVSKMVVYFYLIPFPEEIKLFAKSYLDLINSTLPVIIVIGNNLIEFVENCKTIITENDSMRKKMQELVARTSELQQEKSDLTSQLSVEKEKNLLLKEEQRKVIESMKGLRTQKVLAFGLLILQRIFYYFLV